MPKERHPERKKSVPLKDLLYAVLMGSQDEDVFISLAGRLGRIEKQIDLPEREKIQKLTNGNSINDIVKGLLDAFNPDKIEEGAPENFLQ